MLDIHGMPIRGTDNVHAWLPDQIIYFRRDPTTDSLYPLSRILQLFSCAVIEDMMLSFIGGKFTESNVPYGIYDMGDISDTELKVAVSNWNDQATSNHKIILTGSRGQSTWTQFGYALKELEATNLLQVVQGRIMALLGVTKNEFGDSQDVNKGNGYNLSYTFKRRAIEPLLNEVTETLTRHFVHKLLGFTDLEIYYEEIDSRDALLEGQIDDIYLKSGVYSPNYIANRKGLPSVPGGDDRLLLIGTNAIPLDLVRPFALAQLEAIQAEVTALKMGQQQAKIEPPALKGPQPAGRSTVPDGVGSSGTHISYPKASAPQQARGPVQANRYAGIRKESIS
jgi:Phage portal protein